MRPLSPAQRRAAVAAVFDEVADHYDDVGVDWFRPIARRLVGYVRPAPGERAVDLGCGRGAALFPLAEAVGPTGMVTGVDLSARMIAATRADVRARGLDNVDLHVGDAAEPDLPAGGFDVAVASFVLFFLPAPVPALRAWRALLAPGGRLGVSTFADSDAGWLPEVFRPYLPATRFGSPFATDAGVEGLLTAAGFAQVHTRAFDFEVGFADADQWYEWSRSHGQRAVWDRIPAADQERVRAATEQRLAEYCDAEGRIRFPQRIRCTLGRRPA